MVLTIYFMGIILLFATIYITKTIYKNRRLPPGPYGVPVLGFLPFLDVFHLGDSFSKLSRKYGEIFSLKVGTELAIVLNSAEAIRKVFSNNDICDRPDTFMFRFFSQGEKGIASASGETWQVQRKFTYMTLKKFGFGRKEMETYIQDEVRDLIEVLKEKGKNGTEPVEIGFEINVAVVNIIWSIISGERRDHNDKKIKELLEAVNKGIELASTSGILLFMPFLAKIFPKRLFGIDLLKKWTERSHNYIQEVVDSQATDDTLADPNNFIQAFLREMTKEDAHHSFTKQQLLILCSELFGAGGEPTSAVLKWAIRYLAMYPEIQSKAQAEIDAHLQNVDRHVELSDRPSLPYMEALIMDLIRISDIHPIGVLHSPSRDVTIDGLLFPKGSFVFPNFHHVHRSSRYWEKPNDLYPEHWLDSQGKFVQNNEGFLAFGTGKRKCPGQEVAYLEMFGFLSNLLRNFTFKLPLDDNGRIETTAGVVVAPKPYKIIVENRL